MIFLIFVYSTFQVHRIWTMEFDFVNGGSQTFMSCFPSNSGCLHLSSPTQCAEHFICHFGDWISHFCIGNIWPTRSGRKSRALQKGKAGTELLSSLGWLSRLLGPAEAQLAYERGRCRRRDIDKTWPLTELFLDPCWSYFTL